MSLSDFERDLLASAPNDAPSPERKAANRARTMRAAGLATAVVAASTTSTTTTTAASAAGAAKGLGLAKVVALVAVGLAGAAAVVGVARHATRPEGAPAPVASVSAAPVSARPPSNETTAAAPPSATPAPEVTPAPAPAPAPSASVTPSSARPIAAPPASASASASASSPSADPLSVETALLEAARACASRGDLTCASAKLADHETRFPRGALADEAALLRIEVAHQRGDAVTTRRLAERFLESHPSGSYARRARAIVAELDAR